MAPAQQPPPACVCLWVCVRCSPGSPRPPCVLVLVPWPHWRQDSAGLGLHPHATFHHRLKCTHGDGGGFFSRKHLLDFPTSLSSSFSLPVLFPLWHALFLHEGQQHFRGTDGLGLGRYRPLRDNGLPFQLPFSGEPEPSRGVGWLSSGTLQLTRFSACLSQGCWHFTGREEGQCWPSWWSHRPVIRRTTEEGRGDLTLFRGLIRVSGSYSDVTWQGSFSSSFPRSALGWELCKNLLADQGGVGLWEPKGGGVTSFPETESLTTHPSKAWVSSPRSSFLPLPAAPGSIMPSFCPWRVPVFGWADRRESSRRGPWPST